MEGLQALQTMATWLGLTSTPRQSDCLPQAGVHIWVVSPLWVERSAAEQRRAMVRLRQPSCCLPLHFLLPSKHQGLSGTCQLAALPRDLQLVTLWQPSSCLPLQSLPPPIVPQPSS